MKTKVQILLFAFLLLANLVFSQVPGYVPGSGLQGWWPFSGNANDASAAGNNFTNNSAVLTTDRYGTSNSAYQFNGSTQYLYLAAPNFTFGGSSSFTVSFWMHRSATGYGVAMMHGTTANGNFIWNFQTNTASDLQFGTNKQGSAWTWAQTAYSINQWVNFTATFANGVMQLYKDGVPVATNTYTHTGAAQITLPIYIGRGVGGAYFSGKIDDVGIWNRVLTAAEINTLYTGCNVDVTSQPTSNAAVTGANVQFSVASNATGATYQWQHKVGSGYVNLVNGGQFAGATTDTLVVNSATMSNNGEQFRCVVGLGTGCADTSNAATLTVCGAINVQPLSQTITLNNPAQFVAGNTDPSATFAWQTAISGVFGNIYNGAIFSGVSTDTLNMSTVGLINNGQKFRCIITSGSCIDTTNEAVLTVINNIGVQDLAHNTIQIFPNPAGKMFGIVVPTSFVGNHYALTNTFGQVVLQGVLESELTQVNINQLPNGSYVFVLDDITRIQIVIAH